MPPAPGGSRGRHDVGGSEPRPQHATPTAVVLGAVAAVPPEALRVAGGDASGVGGERRRLGAPVVAAVEVAVPPVGVRHRRLARTSPPQLHGVGRHGTVAGMLDRDAVRVVDLLATTVRVGRVGGGACARAGTVGALEARVEARRVLHFRVAVDDLARGGVADAHDLRVRGGAGGDGAHEGGDDEGAHGSYS